MRKHHPFFLASTILILASLACQALSTTPTATVSDETQSLEPTQPQPTAPAAVQPALVASQGVGMACIGSNTGLSCLTENGWQTYTDQNSDLPNPYLYEGAACPDGQITIAHINGVVLFDGSVFKLVPETDAYSSPEGLACDASGALWVAHFRGVSKYANGQWATYGSENLAGGDSANDLVYDVQVASDGKVWVLTSRSVAMFENETWTVYQEGQGFSESRFFNALTLDAQGRPWAAHSTGVDVFENGIWKTIGRDDYNSPSSLALDATGGIWIGTLSGGAYRFDGNLWTHYARTNENLLSDSINVIATDSGGRTWLGTTYGLTVFDGTTWRSLLMSNSGLGDNQVGFIVVTKDGPPLPASEEKPRSSLTGKLETASGAPLANARVEICVEILASSYSGETPCSDQPFSLTTTTNADGIFLFENVPAGYYVIVAETGDGTWAQLTDQFGITSERTLIPAGEAYDIGTLTLEE